MIGWYAKAVLVLLIFLGGCNANRDSSPANPRATSSGATQTESTSSGPLVAAVEPGFYEEGDAFERVSAILAQADAQIRLDYHSGIEWYDEESENWIAVSNVSDVHSLLDALQNKRLVSIATGKAAWEKYDEYIGVIAESADALGFEMTLVTDDSSRGLVVSRVIHHDD